MKTPPPVFNIHRILQTFVEHDSDLKKFRKNFRMIIGRDDFGTARPAGCGELNQWIVVVCAQTSSSTKNRQHDQSYNGFVDIPKDSPGLHPLHHYYVTTSRFWIKFDRNRQSA